MPILEEPWKVPTPVVLGKRDVSGHDFVGQVTVDLPLVQCPGGDILAQQANIKTQQLGSTFKG